MPDTIIQKRNQFLKTAVELDIEIMKLNDMIAENLQKAVDIEIRSLGVVSEITQNFLETYHYRIEGGRVTAMIPTQETKNTQEKPLLPPSRKITQTELDKIIAEHQEKQRKGIYEVLDLSNCLFENITFKGGYRDILFVMSDFKNCTFQNAQMENISFSKADFIGGGVLQSNFNNCNFYDSGINFSQFNDSTFNDCSFLKTAFFAGKIVGNQFYQCDFAKSWIGQTEFSDNMLQKCQGIEEIDILNNAEAYQQNFKKNPFADNGIRYKFTIKTADFKNNDFGAVLQAHQNGKQIIEREINVNYNTISHKIEKMDSKQEDTLLKKIWDLMQPEIEKEVQKQEYDNRIPTAGIKVMVHKSESLCLQDKRMYDLKEFAARIDSFKIDSCSSNSKLGTMQHPKVEFTLIFNTPRGNVQHYKDSCCLGKNQDLLNHIKESKFFSNAEIHYLESYIKNTTTPMSDQIRQTAPIQRENEQLKLEYRGEAYIKGTGEKQIPVCITGHTPEEVLTALRIRNRNQTADKQLVTCYMKKINPQTHQYETQAKYDIKTGLDITPIYLQLPHVKDGQWEKIKDLLKKNGAKYNPQKKAFYITRQNDLNFFASYIPANVYAHLKSQTLVKNPSSQKTPISSKLNENKNKTNSTHLNQHRQKKADALVL